MAWASNDKEKAEEDKFAFLKENNSKSFAEIVTEGESTTFTMRIPKKLLEAYKKASAKKGITVSAWLKMITIERLEEDKKKGL